MTPRTSDESGVIERLEKLERQNRRMKQVAAVVLVLGALFVLLTFQVLRSHGSLILDSKEFGIVEADEFILRDVDGTRRASLSMTSFGPQLVLLDANGQTRVLLESGELSLHNPQGKLGARLSLFCTDTCSPELVLRDESEKHQIWLYANTAGSNLEVGGIFAGTATPGLLLGSDDGGPQIKLLDRQGFQATIGTVDLVTIRTSETRKTSAASVVLFDKDNKVLWSAP